MRERTAIQGGVAAITAVLAAFLGNAAPAGGDVILNGDFEVYSAFFAPVGSPVVSGGWTFSNNAGVELAVGNPSKAARLEANGSASFDPTIAQTVSGLEIGQSYHLSWDLALRINFGGSGTGRSFGVFLDNQTFGDALYLGEYLGTSYQSQSIDFVATSTSHTFIFAGELDDRSNGGVGTTDVSYRIDNISLTSNAIPEPAGWVFLLGTSLVVLGRRRNAND